VRRGAFRWPVIVLVSAFAVGLLLLGESGLPLRPIITIWFLIVCPGMAFVPMLPIKDGLAAFTVGIGVSLAIDALIAEAMVYTTHWSATWSLAILVGIAGAGAAWQLRRGTMADDHEMRRSHGLPAAAASRDGDPARGYRVLEYEYDVGARNVPRGPRPAVLSAPMREPRDLPVPPWQRHHLSASLWSQAGRSQDRVTGDQ
jgi:hypothetical protein